MMKSRVLHIITTLDTGGAEHHLLSLLPKLQRKGYAITLVYLKGAGTLAGRFREEGIEVINLHMKGVADPSLIWKNYQLVKKGSYEIVHTHLFKADFYGGLAARFAGCSRIVCTKHNEDQYLRTPFFAFLARMIAGFNVTVVVISDACGRFMVDVAGIPAQKLRRIYYGIDIAHGVGDDGCLDQVLGELSIADSAPILASVGRLSPQKGQRYLLQAMPILVQRFPSIQLLLVGEGPAREELLRLTQALDLERHVIFTGLRTDVMRLLQAVDVFVLPSLWEGFGLVLLEAMVARRPIVASSVGAIPEIVLDGKTGLLVPPRQPDHLAEAILDLLHNPARAERMGQAGRKRVEAEFSLDRMVAQWDALYEGLLASKGSVV